MDRRSPIDPPPFTKRTSADAVNKIKFTAIDNTDQFTTTLSFDTPTSNKLVTIPAGEDGTVLLHSSGTVATALTLSGALTCSSTVDLSAAQISGTNALVFGGGTTSNSNKLTLAVTEPAVSMSAVGIFLGEVLTSILLCLPGSPLSSDGNAINRTIPLDKN